MGVLYARVAGAWVPVGGGGSGADEVHVGPDQPADTLELWVDTDETAPLPDDTRWNTAWGIVAMLQPRMSVAEPIATAVGGAYLTEVMPFTTIVGRRYRFVATVRAINRPSYSFFLTWTNGYDTGAGIPGFFAYWVHDTPANTWGGTVAEWIMDGDGVARNYAVLSQCPDGTAQLYHQSSDYYIEDMGPVSGAAPALMTTTDRWNTAWGQIATETPALTPADGTAVTAGLVMCGANSVTLLMGRRYRFTFQVRAMENGGVSGAFLAALYKNGFAVSGAQAWIQNQYNYESSTFSFNVTGDGAAANWTMVASSVVGTPPKVHLSNAPGNILSIEDIGPVSGAVPIADPTPPWIPMGALANGWTAFAGEPPPSYRKIGDKVEVRGSIKNATPMTNPSASTFFTLPPGHTPPYSIYPTCFGVGTDGYGCPAIMVVQANGQLRAVRNVTNASPHVQTAFEFQFSVTP